MKYLVPAVLMFVMLTSASIVKEKSIYDFKVESIDGKTIDLKKYKGKKLLIVNTASKCGYTPQYKALEELQQKYKGKLVVIGFPSDNFGGQEFQQNSQIKEFCQKNYGVTFPLTARVDVKGDKAAPIFKYLCNKSENGVLDAEIAWNFNKFLVDENGKLIAHFGSKTLPDSPDIIKYIAQK
jgi:glutathione peroxidase